MQQAVNRCASAPCQRYAVQSSVTIVTKDTAQLTAKVPFCEAHSAETPAKLTSRPPLPQAIHFCSASGAKGSSG